MKTRNFLHVIQRTLTIIKCVFTVLICLCCTLLTYAQQPKLKELKGDDLFGDIYPAEKKGKWGYINEKGKFIIKPIFDEALNYSDGYAIIRYSDKYGVIDRASAFLHNPIYDSINLIRVNGVKYYLYSENQKKGVMDGRFNPISNAIYENISPITTKAGCVFIGSANNRQNFFGQNIPSSLLSKDYHNITWSANDSCFYIENDGLYGYISEDLSFICEPRFSECPKLTPGPKKIIDERTNQPLVLTKTGVYTIQEYDNYLHKTLPFNDYAKTDELPIWMKRHVKMKGKPQWINSGDVPYNRINTARQFEGINEYDKVYKEFFMGEWTLYIPSFLTELEGNNEYRHNVKYMSFYDNVVVCLYQDYKSKNNRITAVHFDRPFIDLKPKKKRDKEAGVERLMIDNGKSSDFKTLVTNAVRSNENYSISGDVIPLQFCVLSSGDYLLTFRIRYNGRDEVIAYDKPQYANIMGQTVLVNDGIYTERHYDFFEIALILNRNTMEVEHYLHLPDYRNNQVLADTEGGFYCIGYGPKKARIIMPQSPMLKFTNDGKLEWKYVPKEGETIYDLDGISDVIYMVGNTTSQGIIGQNNSLFITMSNDGSIANTDVNKGGTPYKTLKVYKNGIYASDGSTYNISLNAYRLNLLKEIKDARLMCKYTSWGNVTNRIGGCGLYDSSEGWIIKPVLPNSKPESADGWTIYPFEGNRAKVVKDGETMYVGKDGKVITQ